MPSFDTLIFDLGSTLLYFDGEWSRVYPQADIELARYLQAAGLKFNPETFLKEFRARMDDSYEERETEFIEHPTAQTLRKMLDEWGFRHAGDEVVESALKSMYRITQAYWKVEEDARPTLQRLREQGYRLGIISNAADDPDVQTLVDKAGLRSYFEVILSSAAVGLRKPHPEIFKIALKALETPPARAAMIGDTLEADILGGQQAGMFTIWITRRAVVPANSPSEDSIKPNAVIGKLNELPNLLKKLDLH
jgi:HAD superfamily hydrolase (TIGR01549 family)